MIGKQFVRVFDTSDEQVEKLLRALDMACVSCLMRPLNGQQLVQDFNEIIDWHVDVALNPAVSEQAKALIERGRQEQLKDIFGDK